MVTSRAKNDIYEIGRYITTELLAPEAADNLLNDLERQIADLQYMPNRFALVSAKRLAELGIRSVPIKNYTVFYTVDEKAGAVTIISVMYGRRDWVNLL